MDPINNPGQGSPNPLPQTINPVTPAAQPINPVQSQAINSAVSSGRSAINSPANPVQPASGIPATPQAQPATQPTPSFNAAPQEQPILGQPAMPEAPAGQNPGMPGASLGAEDPGKTMGIISIVLAFVFSLAGLIVGIIARKKSKDAGFPGTLGTIGAVLSAIFMILGVILAILLTVATANEIENFETNNLQELNTTELIEQ